MGTNVQTPDARNYGQETRDTLQAQIDLAPQKFAAEQQFGPQYQQLQLGMLQQALPQLLSMYQNQISPVLSQTEAASRSLERGADIADVSALGPLARQAQASAAPEEAGLVGSLLDQAKAGLAAGTALTPEQQRAMQQQSREAFGARGIAGSPGSAVDEIVRSQAAGQAAQLQRQGVAGNALTASQNFYGNPFQTILGRQTQAFGMAPGFANQAQGFNPGQLFNPESQYSADIYNQGWQGQLASNTATAANKNAINTGLLNIAASGAGAA